MNDAMLRLTEPWTITVTIDERARIPYAGMSVRQFPPLIDMLRGHVTPDTGKTRGGANDPSSRSVLDIKSLDLLMHIEDVVRAWLGEWRIPAADIREDLRAFWDRLDTLHRADSIDQVVYEGLAALPDVWAVRIWDLIEPPQRLALREAACPRCDRAKITNADNESADNLLILWRDGQEPTAECQWEDCGAIWVGEAGLKTLGRELGVEFNIKEILTADDTEITIV